MKKTKTTVKRAALDRKKLQALTEKKLGKVAGGAGTWNSTYNTKAYW